MRFLHASSKFALANLAAWRIETAMAFSPGSSRFVSCVARSGAGSAENPVSQQIRCLPLTAIRLFSLSGDRNDDPVIRNVSKEEMEEIIEDYEEGGREASGYVIIDVREPSEIAATGKLSPNTLSVPLGVLAQYQIFQMDEEDFEEVCGFPKQL
jgi:hypothetical protein